MKITRMKVNGVENPIGFDYDPLIVSWVTEEARGKRQVDAKN